MRLKKISTIFIIVFLCIFFTGCWDRVEIEKKSFVSILGIDAGKNITQEKEIKKIPNGSYFSNSNIDKLKITYAFPDISGIGPEKGGAVAEKHISAESYSMENAVDKASSKSSRILDFGHLKLLIINKKMLQYENTFKEVLDYLQRNVSLNRTVYFVLSEDSTEEILGFKPAMEKGVESYIEGILDSNKKNQTAFPLVFGNFLESMTKCNCAVVPIVDYDNNEVKISKVALIKNYKVVGELSLQKSSNLQLLSKRFKRGMSTIIKNGSPLDYEIDNFSRRIKLKNFNKDKLNIDVYVKLEGRIKGYSISKNIFSKPQIINIEKEINKSLENEIKQTMKVCQSKYNIDIIELQSYIKRHHPFVWKKIKNNWDDVYKNSNIDVHIDAKVRRIGSIK